MEMTVDEDGGTYECFCGLWKKCEGAVSKPRHWEGDVTRPHRPVGEIRHGYDVCVGQLGTKEEDTGRCGS